MPEVADGVSTANTVHRLRRSVALLDGEGRSFARLPSPCACGPDCEHLPLLSSEPVVEIITTALLELDDNGFKCIQMANVIFYIANVIFYSIS